MPTTFSVILDVASLSLPCERLTTLLPKHTPTFVAQRKGEILIGTRTARTNRLIFTLANSTRISWKRVTAHVNSLGAHIKPRIPARSRVSLALRIGIMSNTSTTTLTIDPALSTACVRHNVTLEITVYPTNV